MAPDLEWYLTQSSNLVDRGTKESVRARIQLYIDREVDGQPEPTHVTRSQKRQIYEAYLFNEDGRLKFAQSMVRPTLDRYHRYQVILDNLSQPIDWTWGEVIQGIRAVIIDTENFLSIYPEEERFIEPLGSIRVVMEELYGVHREALFASAGLDLDAIIPGKAVSEEDRLPLDRPASSV